MPAGRYFALIRFLFPLPLGAAELPSVVLSGESRGTATRLAEARKLLTEKKPAEAIRLLQSVLDSSGNDLVPVTPERSVQARRVCHLLLAGLPKEQLQLYRKR